MLNLKDWYLGTLRGLPTSVKTVLDFGRTFVETVDDALHSPDERVKAAQLEALKIRQRFAEDRGEASDRAVARGRDLIQFRKDHGRGEWRHHVETMGISRRAASNLTKLAYFQYRAPRLYDRLRLLGPTKLYRIARLSDDDLLTIDPDKYVDVEGKTMRLRHLTDRELIVHLRKRFPPKRRPHGKLLRSDALRLQRRANDLPAAEQADRDDLQAARDAAQIAVNRLNSRLDGPAHVN